MTLYVADHLMAGALALALSGGRVNANQVVRQRFGVKGRLHARPAEDPELLVALDSVLEIDERLAQPSADRVIRIGIFRLELAPRHEPGVAKTRSADSYQSVGDSKVIREEAVVADIAFVNTWPAGGLGPPGHGREVGTLHDATHARVEHVQHVAASVIEHCAVDFTFALCRLIGPGVAVIPLRANFAEKQRHRLRKQGQGEAGDDSTSRVTKRNLEVPHQQTGGRHAKSERGEHGQRPTQLHAESLPAASPAERSVR
jgi:hypothetical protein